ncbi:hypothetical protein SAMN05444008_101448 [Cnuella takakiae]|uniref:Uncharacterized protein n=1 Tax=Cnuella takakiae TaxID=1302690 RepID=A0A1M4TMV2_9BACT|nr:hypothetical protein [Cnuella takakiae]OLY90770.1 hypothetical protein BUE76_01795 [Cnuella takakiae]SHE45832.1 hypothetical protein SAMN05444008_101448 [Cnuella takakiae]
MPKQKGILQLEGALGDLSFYHTKWGWLVRRKGGASKERIATQPCFQRTRENNLEFAQAVQAARLLRQAFLPMIGKAVDKQLMSRLVQALLRVIRTDTLHERGQRQLTSGRLELLEGMAFNAGSTPANVLPASCTAGISTTAGSAWVELQSFIPARSLQAPAGATHYRLGLGIAGIDFATNNALLQEVQTGLLPLDDAPTDLLRLEATLPGGQPHTLFAALGLHLLQAVNGSHYPLHDGSCLWLVAVSKA